MSLTGRRVAVTGAAGFIGSHLVEELVRRGAKVRALATYNSRGSIGSLRWAERELLDSVDLHFGDVRDPRLVREFLDGNEIVFHLAALISVPYSYVTPRLFYDVNVSGTINVLEAARDVSVGRIVHTSTSEVYGTPETIPITERHPLKAQSPYAASKVAADKVAESFRHSYDLPVVTVRPFNTYGPRQSTRAVIPKIVSQALTDGGELRLGRLDPVRDLVFVKDTVAGFIAAGLAAGVEGETIQLATGVGVSVGSLVREVGSILGRDLIVKEDGARVRPAASEVLRLIGDVSKSADLLAWRPRYSLTEGLTAVIEWFRARRNLEEGAGPRYV